MPNLGLFILLQRVSAICATCDGGAGIDVESKWAPGFVAEPGSHVSLPCCSLMLIRSPCLLNAGGGVGLLT